MENNEWVLERIDIKRELWGGDKGKYKGEIKFSNGKDQFTFALNPTLARLYLDLIKDTVVLSANQLGENLAKSLNQIDESTSTEEKNKDAIADWAADYNKPNQITK